MQREPEPTDMSAFDDYRVTVFGGTGFLGRRVVARLACRCRQVRVAVRHPRDELFADFDGVEQVRADVRDQRSVTDALAGADAVVNAVSLYREQRGASFEQIHVYAAERLAEKARSARARLIQMSGIGVDSKSPSAYIRARALGEERVRAADPDALILRSSVLFGPDDAFLGSLGALVRRLPVIPLFGRGDTRLQPVYVDDAASAIAKLCGDVASAERLYELCGPRVYRYRELLALIAREMGRQPVLLPVPFFAWEFLVALLSLLPNPPITRDQLTLMRHDNVADPVLPRLAQLEIEPRALEDLLPGCLDEEDHGRTAE